MGLLKKLQAANPDDSVSDGVDGEFMQTEESAEATESAKTEAVNEPEVLEAEFVPAEVIKLESLLRAHDWWTDYSDDPSVRAGGAKSWDAIAKQLERCKADGSLAEAKKAWIKYAPEEYVLPEVLSAGQAQEADTPANGAGYPAVRPAEPFSSPYERNLFAQPLGSRPVTPGGPVGSENPANEPQPQYVSGQTSMLSKALSAPFAVTAAAGSLIVDSLRYAGGAVKSFYVKGRENGHSILGQQMTETADRIVSLTSSLKEQGMQDLIADMKRTGRPASELFEGMKQGGPHQHFSDRFTALMKNEAFADTYAKLEDSLTDFGFKASHYAQVGVELNKDYSEVIERNLEKISAATEGFIFKKNGVIKHLQELARSISERISNMVNTLLGRHQPQ